MSEYEDYPLPGGWDLIPPYMHQGVYAFVMDGIRPGDFLSALLRDDPFSEVAARADSTNLHQLGNWARFIHNYVPSVARREGFEVWIAWGGVNRKEQDRGGS